MKFLHILDGRWIVQIRLCNCSSESWMCNYVLSQDNRKKKNQEHILKWLEEQFLKRARTSLMSSQKMLELSFKCYFSLTCSRQKKGHFSESDNQVKLTSSFLVKGWRKTLHCYLPQALLLSTLRLCLSLPCFGPSLHGSCRAKIAIEMEITLTDSWCDDWSDVLFNTNTKSAHMAFIK